MKTLFLLRHAEAAADTGGGDFERSLTQNGMEQARTLGRRMREKNLSPLLALCSSARRTRQTLEALMESVVIPAVTQDRAIYHATTGELYDYIQRAGDEYDSVLVVGHNPVMHELAAKLAAEERPDLLSKLARGYPPGTLAVFQCPRASWRDIQPGGNRLMELLQPGTD